ncbi:hypothetical protein CP985_09070 [Malaciobacter mytili LMG 24559]|uniref:Uncharacterized protein n=1 Tax=Malaciobacter mytili LMG 24559 TaxID=1032238 RepID=A0AAX2AE84_9BACT|nr:hypothetical protein [Malaciobacter mytili]AXH14256.1 hypothetical protein AMYT_0662 [Malaciobacter mytili LMG 24559]RXK15302.1 hypothetical protein CP985_09070 [Malaciobacter mytili LMG 24559]
MKIEIKNPKYSNKEKTQVDVELNHQEFGWIPYTFHYETEDESFDGVIREYLKNENIEIEFYSK